MCESPSTTRTAFDAGLRATLLARAHQHRGIRAACRAGVVLWDAVAQLDRDNQTFLSQHLVFRWLGADLVGRDGAHTCGLLVHEAATAAQRRVWFPWMQRAVVHGCADGGDLAFLDDRVAREAGRAQVHGSVTYGDPPRLWPLAVPGHECRGHSCVRPGVPGDRCSDNRVRWMIPGDQLYAEQSM